MAENFIDLTVDERPQSTPNGRPKPVWREPRNIFARLGEGLSRGNPVVVADTGSDTSDSSDDEIEEPSASPRVHAECSLSSIVAAGGEANGHAPLVKPTTGPPAPDAGPHAVTKTPVLSVAAGYRSSEVRRLAPPGNVDPSETDRRSADATGEDGQDGAPADSSPKSLPESTLDRLGPGSDTTAAIDLQEPLPSVPEEQRAEDDDSSFVDIEELERNWQSRKNEKARSTNVVGHEPPETHISAGLDPSALQKPDDTSDKAQYVGSTSNESRKGTKSEVVPASTTRSTKRHLCSVFDEGELKEARPSRVATNSRKPVKRRCQRVSSPAASGDESPTTSSLSDDVQGETSDEAASSTGSDTNPQPDPLNLDDESQTPVAGFIVRTENGLVLTLGAYGDSPPSSRTVRLRAEVLGPCYGRRLGKLCGTSTMRSGGAHGGPRARFTAKENVKLKLLKESSSAENVKFNPTTEYISNVQPGYAEERSEYGRPSALDPEDNQWEVKWLTEKRQRGTKVEYFVEWKGYPLSEGAWTEEEDIDPELIAEFEARTKE